MAAYCFANQKELYTAVDVLYGCRRTRLVTLLGFCQNKLWICLPRFPARISRSRSRFGSFKGGILLTMIFISGWSFTIPLSDFINDLLAALGYFVLMTLIPHWTIIEFTGPATDSRDLTDLSSSSIYAVFYLIRSNHPKERPSLFSLHTIQYRIVQDSHMRHAWFSGWLFVSLLLILFLLHVSFLFVDVLRRQWHANSDVTPPPPPPPPPPPHPLNLCLLDIFPVEWRWCSYL